MSEVIEKNWGKETYFASTDQYTGKFLEFNNVGDKTSMHFHKEKDETLVVLKGSFTLRIINVITSSIEEAVLVQGDRWRNVPLQPHQFEAREPGSILIEVSTPEPLAVDIYRISPGTLPKDEFSV